jgi:hypothetical protein
MQDLAAHQVIARILSSCLQNRPPTSLIHETLRTLSLGYKKSGPIFGPLGEREKMSRLERDIVFFLEAAVIGTRT